MFKRRKPDDLSNAPGAALPAGLPADFGDAPQDAGPDRLEVRSVASDLSPETELGVPPYRPAPPKEVPAMSRPPFSPSAVAPPASAPTTRPGLTPVRPPAREPAERRTLVVGRGISVQGTVQDAERLVVEGAVEATMIHASELSIASGGVFKGEVEVEDAEIAGTMDGTLTVRAALVVRATGKLLGTARCRRLQVEDGGQISGRIEMINDQARGETAPRSAAEAAG